MSDKYILDSHGNPVPEKDTLKWAEWFGKRDRHLALDKLPNGVRVSTVFLGLDHSFGDGPPVLWETMIFGGLNDQYQQRYSSREDAVAGHKRAVLMAKGEA